VGGIDGGQGEAVRVPFADSLPSTSAPYGPANTFNGTTAV
jgi:hypothetical protein